MDPGFAGWYNRMGEACLAWSKKKDALTWFKKALEKDASLEGIKKKTVEIK